MSLHSNSSCRKACPIQRYFRDHLALFSSRLLLLKQLLLILSIQLQSSVVFIFISVDVLHSADIESRVGGAREGSFASWLGQLKNMFETSDSDAGLYYEAVSTAEHQNYKF